MGENDEIPKILFAVAVSDLHLGYDECDVDSFRNFLQNFFRDRIVENFILLGDIFDLWRRDNIQVIKDYSDILKSLLQLIRDRKIVKLHYVIGNHDFTIEEVLLSLKDNADNNLSNLGIEIEQIKNEGKLQFYGEGIANTSRSLALSLNGGQPFYFIHGQNLEWSGILTDESYREVLTGLCSADDTTGPILDAIWKGITFFSSDKGSPLLLRWRIISVLFGKCVARKLVDDMEESVDERQTLKNILLNEYRRDEVFQFPVQSEAEKAIMELAKLYAGYDPDSQYLIFGHTHQSGKGEQISNTGCWYKSKKNEERLLVINRQGDVTIHKYS
jgi:UDP-2,3-diacylglucosamine pyrophosphatase LpxH